LRNPIISIQKDTFIFIKLSVIAKINTSHLLEAGVALRQIQLLLGHSSSKAREIYTHVANSSLSLIKIL